MELCETLVSGKKKIPKFRFRFREKQCWEVVVFPETGPVFSSLQIKKKKKKISCTSVWSCFIQSSRHDLNAAMNIMTLSAQFEEPNFKSTHIHVPPNQLGIGKPFLLAFKHFSSQKAKKKKRIRAASPVPCFKTPCPMLHPKRGALVDAPSRRKSTETAR